MVDKPVVKKSVAVKSAAKPVATPTIVAKPAVAKADTPKSPAAAPVASKVEAPKPVAAPAVTKVEAPKPVTVPAVAKVEAPKPIVAPAVAKVEAPKPVVATPAPKPVAVAAPVAAAPTPAKTPVAVMAPIIVEGKTLMNDTVTKVQETAQKFTADATARATEVFGDVSARAKTALEKSSKGLEEFVDFSKGNLEAVVASGRVAAKGAQDIAKYSADYGRKSIEEATANAKKFAAVKSPTEFFALQSEVAKTQLDAFVGEASKFTEGYLKLLGEIVQPVQNRYAVAAEKVKSAVAA